MPTIQCVTKERNFNLEPCYPDCWPCSPCAPVAACRPLGDGTCNPHCDP